MSTYAKLRTDAVIMNPISSVGLENNTLFADSADSNKFKNKDDGGTPLPVESSASLFLKNMQSGFAGVIPINTPVSKLSNGKITPADSDAVGGQEPVGITMVAFATINDIGSVHMVGPNVAGALTGLGFTSGQEIYIGEGGSGYTNDPNSFTGDNDSIIRIGIADCAAGAASGTATDLIIDTQVIIRP